MPVFPSVEWFQAVADRAMADEQYKKFGRVDALVGVQVGERNFALTFDVFDIRDIREIGPAELRDLDFYLRMPPDLWRAMIEDIQREGHGGREYTLNTLDLKLPDGLAVNALGDGYRMDKFFRFNQSLQRFFDLAADVPTTFDLPQTAATAS
ncbi:MAG TPA: hypothetical protein VFA70_00310 [Dehalococcoidia bacterium]|nr:hypothetical protein [Dehalococcoidia bacterium]